MRIGNWFSFQHYGDLGVSSYLKIGTRQKIRGPYLRIGNIRIGWDRTITRYKVASVGDHKRWNFYVDWDSKRNTFKGDRTIYWNKS